MKRTFTQVCLLLFFSALAVPRVFAANLQITPAVVEFSANTPSRQSIEVAASDDRSAQYIEVSISRVLNPGTQQERLITVSANDDSSLIVTPPRFVLPVNGTKAIELTSMKTPANKDQVFQLTMTSSVISEATESTASTKKSQTVLVILRPEETTPQLATNRTNGQLIISNTDNTNVVLYDGMSCSPASECMPVEHKRLFAGQSWPLSIKPDYQISFVVYDGARTYRQVFQ